jgi:nitrite reductase/ring-hydroxylating ferredoxin subunit
MKRPIILFAVFFLVGVQAWQLTPSTSRSASSSRLQASLQATYDMVGPAAPFGEYSMPTHWTFFSKKEEQDEEEEESSSSWVPSFLRRDRNDDDKQKKKAEEKLKATEAKEREAKKLNSREEREQKMKRKEEEKLRQRKRAEEIRESGGLTSAFQSFFNKTQGEDDKEDDQLQNNSTNPFSAAQKFLSSIKFGSSDSKESWVDVFPKTRIMPGQLVPVTVAGLNLLVIASKDGRQLYCVANSCPHLGTPLETGQLVRLPIETQSESNKKPSPPEYGPFPKINLPKISESDVSSLLQQDGCEDCIVCPLHKTSFALESGEVRGEWCPYPPFLGNIMGTVKKPTPAAVFEVRTKGKNVQVRINTPLLELVVLTRGL